MLSPDHNRFLINIPKNASSYLCDWTHRCGWFAEKTSDWQHSIMEVIVVLRDPVQRWISGLPQYLSSHVLNMTDEYDTSVGPGFYQQRMSARTFIELYNPVIERLIFDNLDRLDDHVWPQHEFIEGVLPDTRKQYFLLDSAFDSKIQSYLGLQSVENLDRNSGSNDADKMLLQSFFQTLLQSRQDLSQRVRRRYQADYDLISKVLP